jgi:signal transduction histidine kinase
LNEKVQAILVEKQGVLDASLAKLKSSLYTRDKILSILAHDVRSPLSNINGLLELVENGGFNKEEEQELLKKLHEKTDVTLKMVEDVLRWSRLQQEAIVYTPELANGKDICELVNSVCKIYDDLVEKKQIVFNDCSTITSKVKLDRNMMESIIRNLLSNAIKFSDYDPKITITISEEENALLFQIKDKGKGMPKEDIEKLTAGISFTTDQKGTVKGIGLGNQIVMDFLKYHNSHIEVESEVGLGTTISFRIDTI